MWGLLPVSTFKPPWLKIWHKNFVYKVYITHLNIELTMIKLNNAIYDQPKTNPGSVWFSIGCKLSKVDNRLAEETKSAFQLSKNLPTLHEKDTGLVYMQLAHRSGKTGLTVQTEYFMNIRLPCITGIKYIITSKGQATNWFIPIPKGDTCMEVSHLNLSAPGAFAPLTTSHKSRPR